MTSNPSSISSSNRHEKTDARLRGFAAVLRGIISKSMSSLQKNLVSIQNRVEAACIRAGRNLSEVQIVAISKTVGHERISEAMQVGLYDIGENRVQEMLEKMDNLVSLPIRWHLVGHLQSNKVKYILGRVHLIHSLDSLSVVRQVEKWGAKRGETVKALIQVNVSGEQTKSGLTPGEVASFLEELRACRYLVPSGFMTIASFTDDHDLIRREFRTLRSLRDELIEQKPHWAGLKLLSMGMTDDFEIAIEEGAHLIRIGRALFGERAS